MMAHTAAAAARLVEQAGCPAWCSGDHEDSAAHANLDIPPIEVTELIGGKPAVVDLFIEQADGQTAPRVTVSGCLFAHDAQLSLADARRIGEALIARASIVERAGR